MTGLIKHFDPGFLEAKIDTTTTGDNTLVAAVSGQITKVFRIFFIVAGTTNITFKDGSTALTGAIPMVANGSFVLDFNEAAWFTTSANSAFVLNQSGAVQISGRVYYATFPALPAGLPSW